MDKRTCGGSPGGRRRREKQKETSDAQPQRAKIIKTWVCEGEKEGKTDTVLPYEKGRECREGSCLPCDLTRCVYVYVRGPPSTRVKV